MSSIRVTERDEAARQMSVIIQTVEDLSQKTASLTKTIADEGNRIGEGLAFVNQALAPASAHITEVQETATEAKKSFDKILQYLDNITNVAKTHSLD